VCPTTRLLNHQGNISNLAVVCAYARISAHFARAHSHRYSRHNTLHHLLGNRSCPGRSVGKNLFDTSGALRRQKCSSPPKQSGSQ
jgi:hypothetical protein